MQLTRLGHACIRLAVDGGPTVVIDPGVFSSPDALVGAHAVLVTHEHADHFQPEVLMAALEADPALQLWTNGSVAEQLGAASGRVHVVGDGDSFDLDGLSVSVHGEWHELVHPLIPRVGNVGFLLGGSVFHPGDAFTLPGVPVESLLVPLHGPWSKSAEVLDYVRDVAPTRAFPMHDGLLNERGQGLMANLLTATGAPYHALDSGTPVTVG
ncbi:MBL fold metallo-hydrolase [Acidothermaceae bacterium B102]|nr:MBL fold metallo-hydrolase [Acidothermaceae bacterium B102]